MIAIDAEAAPTGTGRFNRRTLIGSSFGILALPLLAGCGGGDDAPKITAAQVQKLQDSYAWTIFQAFRTRNRGLIKRAETGELLRRDLATMALADRLDQPKAADEYTFPNSAGHPIAPVDGDHRQRLLTVGEYSNTTQSWRNLGLYVRQDPNSPWLRAFSGGLYAADVPEFSTSPVPVVAPGSSDFAIGPQAAPGIVAGALQNPDSAVAARFAASDVRQRYADDLATETNTAAAIGTVSRRYKPGALLIALEVDGGYLALGSFSFTQTIVAGAGKHVTFKSDTPQYKAYPAKYRETTSTFDAMFAVMVPAAGKITLISSEERQTGLQAS